MPYVIQATNSKPVAVATLEDHGDLDKHCRRLIRSLGFEPWGNGGWIRDDEGGDTCYDDIWALRHAVEMSPLPDGTTIQVERVTWDRLLDDLPVADRERLADTNLTRDAEVIAAWNAKQAAHA